MLDEPGRDGTVQLGHDLVYDDHVYHQLRVERLALHIVVLHEVVDHLRAISELVQQAQRER